jgi:hypothetical protein
MSITKKRSKRANTESLRGKNRERFVVNETAIRDFIESLSIHHIDEVAARLQSVADITGGIHGHQISQSDLQHIKQLASESKNKYYRQIMKAVIAACEQGPMGIKAAHLTARRAVELAFRWSLEYFASLDLYRDKLRKIRQDQVESETR